MEKTHYRKAFNSPYLSSADIVEPTVLTIKFVKLEPDKTKKRTISSNNLDPAQSQSRTNAKMISAWPNHNFNQAREESQT